MRNVTLGAVVAWLCVYYSISPHLWNGSLWWDVGFMALVLMPSTSR